MCPHGISMLMPSGREGRGHARLIITSLIIFIIAFLLFVLLWYFILIMAPTIMSMFVGVGEVGKPAGGGTVEVVRFQEQLSVVVMRWGLMPIFIGGIGDLTPYYILYSVVVALLLAWRAKRRWEKPEDGNAHQDMGWLRCPLVHNILRLNIHKGGYGAVRNHSSYKPIRRDSTSSLLDDLLSLHRPKAADKEIVYVMETSL